MATFRFFDTYHGDVGLRLGEENFNFGYNYSLCFPLVNWLYHAQTFRGNLFREFPLLTQEQIALDEDFEEKVENSVDLYRRLPLPNETFNEELVRARLGRFSSVPGYRIYYHWNLAGNNNLELLISRERLDNDKVFLELTPQTNIEFALDYFRFLTEEATHLGMCGAWVSEIARRLREV